MMAGSSAPMPNVINYWKPDAVIISHSYGVKTICGTDQEMTPGQWSGSMRRIVEKIWRLQEGRVPIAAAGGQGHH